MSETRKLRKQRLQVEGRWTDYVALRDRFVAEGMTPAQARDEALRQIDSRPCQNSDQPAMNTAGTPPPPAYPGQATTANHIGLDFTRQIPNGQIPNADAVQWVAENIANSNTCAADAPSSLALGLLQWVRLTPANQTTFWSSIWPKLLPTSAALKRNQEVDAGKDWDGQGPCPTCNWEPERDEGTERAAVLLAEEWAEIQVWFDSRKGTRSAEGRG
jgi:hypothetical protein